MSGYCEHGNEHFRNLYITKKLTKHVVRWGVLKAGVTSGDHWALKSL
jgi:hypothetical protein